MKVHDYINNLEDKENPQIIWLNKLKDRLLNLNAKNRKIRFFLSKTHAWDLAELLNKIDHKITSIFLTSLLDLLFTENEQEEISFNLTKSLRILKPEEQDKIEANLTKLQRNNQRIYQEKGHKSLFLGLFFLRGYFRNSQKKLQLINAPLVFCPADFEKNQGDLILVISKSRKINYSLFYYLQKELSLSNEKVVNSLRELENNNSQNNWTDYLDLLTSEIQKLIAINSIEVGFSQQLALWHQNPKHLPHELVEQNEKSNILLEPFVPLKSTGTKDKNDELTKDLKENELQITFNFCLTIDSEPNLSLFRDFEKIIQNYSENGLTNWPNSALNLLIGEKRGNSDFPNEEEAAYDNKQKIIYTPFKADPSQIHILKTIFRRFWENTLCVDGPPGTGKSQLICNLLANALVYKKKVLVICEKQVALKVIYDKLKSIGLGSSIIKINDLDQTAETYRDIANIIERKLNPTKPSWINLEEFSTIEERKKQSLKRIENYCAIDKEFYTNHQTSLNEVYLKRNISIKLPTLLVSLSQWIKNKEKLENLKTNLETYITKFTKVFQKHREVCLQLKHLFFQLDNFKSSPMDQKNILQELITDLLKELKGESSTTRLLSRIWQINLIQKHGKNSSNYHSLKTKLADLHDLITNHHLKVLFSFLGVKDFKDFFHKCNNEKFLVKLQNFVDQEFLEVTELDLLLKSFDEDTSKNVKYFLEKVLVFQEFNYLNDYVKLTEQAVYFNWLKEVETNQQQNLTNWNWSELKNIQQIQKEMQENKIKLARQFIQTKQQESINKLQQDKNLRSEVNKKRRLTSLKKLFPSLLGYFPIWLTTPEVAASITELQQPSFDFLFFDEASQMLLEKAVPILARAKKCIVIGDEQQMPPTDIFKAYLEEEIWEEEEKEVLIEKTDDINIERDDLEKNSNLLTYTKKYVPHKQELSLMWHYRSLYPELIDFSNQAFYQGNLQITRDCESRKNFSPIEYHYVKNGLWKNRENSVEANYIAQLLDTLPSEKDIGIITFNQKQRNLIINLVEEKFKSENVKNLEEIQGDERDIIIFSIGFAPDEGGKLRLNFGPLNRQGGEKRLNVAITRAKEKVIIVTSILPGNEKLKKITDDSKFQLGPKLFKKYLEYGLACWQKDQEKMQEILENSIPKIVNLPSLEEQLVAGNQYDSPFEEEVYKELIKLGYPMQTQVGSVGYKIDLVIYHPQNNQAILGIECDGYHWHSKPSDIENDSYRQMILESKGWKIHRILSRDWWKNKEGEIERVKKELESSLS